MSGNLGFLSFAYAQALDLAALKTLLSMTGPGVEA